MYKKQKYNVERVPNDAQSVLDKIEKIKNWEDYPIEEITEFEKGDAYILANSITKKVKSTQMRKFYDEALKGLASLKQGNLDDAIVTLSMLKPRVLYAKSRDQLVDITFSEFIKYATKISNFRKDDKLTFISDYERFINFFESIIGYSKYINPKN